MLCSVINEENREIDRFIQLNLNNSKDQANQGDQFKSKGSKSYLIWKMNISYKIIKEKMDCLNPIGFAEDKWISYQF